MGRVMPARPDNPEQSTASRPRKLSLSRRQFWRVVTAAAALAALPTARQIVRRRRPGEPGPTGWFGHC
jgi:hypothetical protein